LTVAAEIGGAALAASEPLPAGAVRLCIVDGQPARNGLYVDIAGIRLYACSEECLKQIQEKGAHVGLVEKSGRGPELIPVQRSRERTKEEILEGMVLIPGGEFARSGEYLVRRNRKPEPEKLEGYRVQVSSFYMDRYEVTIEDYCKFLNDGNEKYVAGGIQRDPDGKFVPPRPELANYPIGGVNYFQARGYATWAGKRLPTEAEWEFAHGGPQGRTYPWGNDEPGQTRANFGPSFGGRKPVGSFPEGRTPQGVFTSTKNTIGSRDRRNWSKTRRDRRADSCACTASDANARMRRPPTCAATCAASLLLFAPRGVLGSAVSSPRTVERKGKLRGPREM